MPTKYRKISDGIYTRFQTQSASGSCVLWARNTCSRNRAAHTDMQTGFFRLILQPHHRISRLEIFPNAESEGVMWRKKCGRVASGRHLERWLAGHMQMRLSSLAERALITLSRPACINTHNRHALCALFYSRVCVFAGAVCAAAALFYLRQAQNTCEHSRCWHAEKQAFDLQTCRCTRRALKLSVRAWACLCMPHVICAGRAHTAWQIGFNVFLILLHSSSWTILKRGQSLAESPPACTYRPKMPFLCLLQDSVAAFMLMWVKTMEHYRDLIRSLLQLHFKI